MKKINSQEDLDNLFTLPHWEEAFIREWHLLSPSYIDNHETIAPNSSPSMFVLICTNDIKYPCIELFFEDVEQINFSSNCDLQPEAIFKNNQISFSFYKSDLPDIKAKNLFYNILDENCYGWKTRYGSNNFFDTSGFLISEIVN